MWNRRVKEDYVSIHAPAWGATRDYFTTARPWPQFQSTHPRGVRHHDSEDIAVLFEVSIHAPAWGATIIRQSNKRGEGMFQSTHPRGVRRGRHGATGRRLCGFNPRTRVGCDPQAIRIVIGRVMGDENVSIHAPAWGATHAYMGISITEECFNPRTRVGCDCFHVLSSRFP